MRVLFCTTGGLGHLLPLRPLASTLRSRGHAVAWVTAPDACPVLEGAGFDLFAAGPTFEASRRQFRTVHAEATRLSGERLSAYTFPRLFGAVLAPAMLDGVEKAVRDWHPDVVVNEPAALAASLVCQARGLRHVTHGYGLPPPKEYLDEALRFLGPHGRARGLVVPSDRGLPLHLRLDIAPPSLQPAAEAGDGCVFRFGAYRPAACLHATPPDGLEAAWLRSPRSGPRIYVTFGTVFNRSVALLAAARAAAGFGGTVVVTVGADGNLARFAGLGAHVHVHRFVDQAALLPQCDIVISHGGAGTLLGAAANGVPHLVLPQGADHFRNGRALVGAGAGRMLSPECQTAAAVRTALAEVLSDGSIELGAKLLAREMAALPHASVAAALLERWASNDRR